MSKLVISRYRVLTAEEERATRQKIAMIRAMLQRCVALSTALAQFEAVEGEDLEQTLERYQRAIEEQRWSNFVNDYNRLYDQLPAIEASLEKRLAEGKGRRLRLEMSALTLAGNSASGNEKAGLEKIAREASGMRTDALDAASAQIEAAVTQRIVATRHTAAETCTAAQIALAHDLMHPYATAPDRVLSVSGRPSAPDAARDGDRARVDQLIAHLAAFDGDAREYVERARDVVTVPDAAQRALRLDSLVIEVAGLVASRRAARDMSRITAEAIAELTPFDGPVVDALRQKMGAVQRLGDVRQARELLDEAGRLAEAEAKRRDCAAVRHAIVKSLGDLGYEVRLQGDGWDEGERLEIRRPDEPNYDVLLSAAANGSVQSKVRAYAHAGRGEGINRRDAEVEQGWCGDLRKLNSLIVAQGFAAEIVHEEGPGTTPQKPLPSRSDARDTFGAASTRTRPLP